MMKEFFMSASWSCIENQYSLVLISTVEHILKDLNLYMPYTVSLHGLLKTENCQRMYFILSFTSLLCWSFGLVHQNLDENKVDEQNPKLTEITLSSH